MGSQIKVGELKWANNWKQLILLLYVGPIFEKVVIDQHVKHFH